MSADLFDGRGRHIDYLRISLTDRCSFRCLYCMPPEGAPHIAHNDILRYEEILRLCAVMAGAGVRRYKITGGEPLCRKGAADFIRSLKRLSGVESVTLTTNGHLLGPLLSDLMDAGLDSITFSLNALSQEIFSRVTRSAARVADILAVMEAAGRTGLRIKLNVVPLRGVNEAELLPLAHFALERGWQIRFIELMPLGAGMGCEGVPGDEIKATLEAALGAMTPLERAGGNGPAQCVSIAAYPGSIGFINAVSHAFCSRCNRLRLTAAGFLKTCLHHSHGLDLKKQLRRGASDEELELAVRQAALGKPDGHAFARPAQDSPPFFMHSIGG
jgi:cyclic pyranopterin phosphate synthase